MSFSRLTPEDLVISADAVTAAMWSNGSPTLNTFFTSSTQLASSAGSYYLDVYNLITSNTASEVQFSIAYGNLLGSGSVLYNPLITGNSPTRTIYGQYRNLIIGDENTNFSFNGVESRDIFAISIERSRYKEKILPGVFTLKLSGSQTITLTDNSLDTTTISYNDAGRVYQLVSGSNGRATTTALFPGITAGYTPSGSYGWFLPDVGLIILNPRALALPAVSGGIALAPDETSNSNGDNHSKLFRAISGSTAASFILNSEETLTSDYVFVRVKNSEYNYTANPSFISGSAGEVLYSSFVNSPQTYITTVGFYNDNNDLLAVAKLSRPLLKDFTKEALIRCKLDF